MDDCESRRTLSFLDFAWVNNGLVKPKRYDDPVAEVFQFILLPLIMERINYTRGNCRDIKGR
jgi:hypothetical protein